MRRIITDIKIKKNKVLDLSKQGSFQDKNLNKSFNSIRPEFKSRSENNKKISRNPQLPKEKRIVSKFSSNLFVLVVLVGIIFWGSYLFEKVEIIVTKKHEIFTLEKHKVFASKDLEARIPFEIMIISDKKNEKINLSESKEVSLKAKGEITFYNEYSKNSEKLLANTYISDEEGKVYLTDKTISVPGYKLDGNKKKVPGKATVKITSFLPGEAYNGSPDDFSINSFLGTTKHKMIYGKADLPLSGGALGMSYSPNEEEKKKLETVANLSFRSQLEEKVDALIPDGYIFYPEASSFSYEIEDKIMSSTPMGETEILGTLAVVLLKKDNLINVIKKDLLPKISKEELKIIEIKNLENLKFNFKDSEQTISKELKSLDFNLTGELDFIWNSDMDQLKDNLSGVLKENISSIFKEDVGIGNANVKIFPPWKKTFPLIKIR